jgi:hypothetical protein
MKSYLAAAVLGALLVVAPARAENQVPNAQAQDMLIRTTLLSLNDANITGNYTVLHDKLSKQFRDQFTADKLKETFKEMSDKKADWSYVAVMSPIAAGDTNVDDKGVLHLKGYFDSKPNRTNYDLSFVPSEGQWKPIGINVDLKAPPAAK